VAPLPGEVGLRFSGPSSRIAISRKVNDPWEVLGALHVEVIARLTQPGGTLVHGDQSFRVWVDNQRTVYLEGPGYSFGIGEIPIGQWASINLGHNGFSQLGGGYSYPVPAGSGSGGSGGGAALTISNVQGVGPQGILIGNRIGSPGEHFYGDIAGVRIWRIDPRSMQNEFLARPLDQALSECWSEFIRKLNEALRNDPRCAEWLKSILTQFQQDFLKALSQKSPAKIEEFRAMCRAYRDLWRAGKAGSPEMLALVARLRDWLRAERLFSIDDPNLMQMVDHSCLRALTGSLSPLDCDSDVQALIRAILGDRAGQLKSREAGP
jgi:hypothetical protein